MFEVIPNWHPLFVHFTVALLSLSVIFFIIQKPLVETALGDNLLVFAKYALWLGALFSIVTIAAGWDAYNTVDHDTPSHAAMTDHKNWGFATVGLFFIAAIWRKIVDSVDEAASIVFIMFLIIGAGLLVTTGHKGSLLVYQFGLGVQSLPAKDDHKSSGGHGHSHSDGESHGSGEDEGHAQNEVGGVHEHAAGESHDHHSDSADMESDMPSAEGMEMDDLTFSLGSSSESSSESSSDMSVDIPKPSNAATSETTVIQKPKIEKYDDGTIRQSLPEVDMEKQE